MTEQTITDNDAETHVDHVKVARGAVAAARIELARWEATGATAQAELESMQARAGDEVLDDPDLVERLPREMAELRDRVDLAGRAIAAQRQRVATAESAYLEAEATALEGPLAEAREELAKHNAKTERMLKALSEHDGDYVPRHLLDEANHRVGNALVMTMPKSATLEDAVMAAERPIVVLLEMAAGRDPQPLIDRWGSDPDAVYPPCVWGEEALIPAPLWLRRHQQAQDTAETTAGSRAKLLQRVDELQAAIARGDAPVTQMQDWTLARPPSLPEQLVSAQLQLAAVEEHLSRAAREA